MPPHPHELFAADIHEALWCSAHWIWNRRGSAKRAGFAFSEETITETVLLDIATSCPHQVTIVAFNKREEGKNGADWEWCFYDRGAGHYLRFLMQAKVLDDKDRLYAHIDRFIGNSGVRQIDRLRETAARRGVPALYAFYNHLNDGARLPLDACICQRCEECWGASVSTLEAVQSTLPDKTFDTLGKLSYPWFCLLCAGRLDDPRDLITRVLIGLDRLDARIRETLGDVDLPVPRHEPEGEAPDYLRRILEMPPDLPIAERAEQLAKLGAENPGVDGVVLIDTTPES